MSQLFLVASLLLSVVALAGAVVAFVTWRVPVLVVSLGMLALAVAAVAALMGAPWLALAQLVMGTLGLAGFVSLAPAREPPAAPVRNGLPRLGLVLRRPAPAETSVSTDAERS
ncbi:hypothetical protein [Rhabdochromatium marinum]|uniref:hypothetical protein n=1 Tax=Rhabdochromatium marinum TaxID=48729 RepID=UPI00190730C4|nr:hypothetical protein [Rhabdochromatium marinum]MBK1648603.1 hypothetical protein [Rhabdochromatium marinum]